MLPLLKKQPHYTSRQGITMGKQYKSHSGRFRWINAYFSIFRHIQELFRYIQNPIKHLQCSILWKLLQLRVRIYFSKLHHEKVCDKNLLILVLPEKLLWLSLMGRNFCNFACSRLLENTICTSNHMFGRAAIWDKLP